MNAALDTLRDYPSLFQDLQEMNNYCYKKSYHTFLDYLH